MHIDLCSTETDIHTNVEQKYSLRDYGYKQCIYSSAAITVAYTPGNIISSTYINIMPHNVSHFFRHLCKDINELDLEWLHHGQRAGKSQKVMVEGKKRGGSQSQWGVNFRWEVERKRWGDKEMGERWWEWEKNGELVKEKWPKNRTEWERIKGERGWDRERVVPASTDASWNTEERMWAIFGSNTEILSYSPCL